MAADQLSTTFAALADPTRRAILARLATGECSVTELAEPFEMSMPAVSKHLRVLERAGLIARGRDAQWRPCRLEAAPLKEVADWAERYRALWEGRFDRLEIYLQELKARRRDMAVSSVANSAHLRGHDPDRSRDPHDAAVRCAPAPGVRGDDASPNTSASGGATRRGVFRAGVRSRSAAGRGLALRQPAPKGEAGPSTACIAKSRRPNASCSRRSSNRFPMPNPS